MTTAERFTADQIRSTYELRPAIEERHRQYKCFWDLTRMHSCAFSLVVNQALMVLLAYTLVQVHLVLRQRQGLNRGVWEYTQRLLSPSLEVVAVYYRQRFCLLTGGIRPHPAGYHRSRPRQVARETETHRARAVFSVRNRACSLAPHGHRHSSRASTPLPISSVAQDLISPCRSVSASAHRPQHPHGPPSA